MRKEFSSREHRLLHQHESYTGRLLHENLEYARLAAEKGPIEWITHSIAIVINTLVSGLDSLTRDAARLIERNQEPVQRLQGNLARISDSTKTAISSLFKGKFLSAIAAATSIPGDAIMDLAVDPITGRDTKSRFATQRQKE